MDIEWQPVKDFPTYSVSNTGLVRGTRGWLLRPGIGHGGYLHIALSRKTKKNPLVKNTKLHRLVAIAFVENPLGLPNIDHIDRNRKNNNASNLRWCTSSQNHQNMWNKPQNASSKYKGVSWSADIKKWCSTIMKDGKTTWLGAYTDEIKAALAYNKAAKEMFGDFAFLNTV